MRCLVAHTAVLFLAISLLAADAFADGQPGLWSVDVGATLLSRSTVRPALLVRDGTTGAELSNVADFDLGWAVGPEIAVRRRLGTNWDIEIQYWGIDGYSASRTLSDPGNLEVPLVSTSPNDFFDTASATYRSRIYNTELNLGRRLSERLRLLAGFRMVQLHESIAAEAYSPTLEGRLAASTANYLYGFQLGADARLLRTERFELDAVGKAGVYGTHIAAAVDGSGTYFSMSEKGVLGRCSFVGEVGVTGRYRICDRWSAYAGYEVLWIDGVALAADLPGALAGSDPRYWVNGTAFYHGAKVGLEFRW